MQQFVNSANTFYLKRNELESGLKMVVGPKESTSIIKVRDLIELLSHGSYGEYVLLSRDNLEKLIDYVLRNYMYPDVDRPSFEIAGTESTREGSDASSSSSRSINAQEVDEWVSTPFIHNDLRALSHRELIEAEHASEVAWCAKEAEREAEEERKAMLEGMLSLLKLSKVDNQPSTSVEDVFMHICDDLQEDAMPMEWTRSV